MFTKILIANRGEIACRVILTARKMGIQTVAVYSDADKYARHVELADEAVNIGPAPSRDSYLQAEKIIAACKQTGAQAVHPGYGFLSENAGFARACADAGLVFIGPPPAAIEAMGLKARAKRLMAEAGVPLVPGYHGADQDPQSLKNEAARIGYPVLIKASAGGGGKGMRIVTQDHDFEAALASCRREAMGSFGDDAVLIERYLSRPRHIEIQVFADCHGHCVHLFERDCSVQRRHQKVLEEAPAPGLGAACRAAMGAAAIAAAKAVGYVGAGTVEFIAEPPDTLDTDAVPGELRFYFMEMNTRLQVEHPVTEAVTGIDLVEWQLRVASGEPLPWRQDELPMHGHAIEARICAENPDANFLPAAGTLQTVRWPEHVAFGRNADGDASRDAASVRVDAGVREGDAVLPFYDSMLAKLIVWGADRAQALARLDAALAATHLVGLHTNVAFLRRVVASDSFAQADLDTALIEREHAALFDAPPLAAELAAAGVIAHTLAVERSLQTADPWSRRNGWRLHGVARRRFEFGSSGSHHAFKLERSAGGLVLVSAARRWPVAFDPRAANTYDVTLAAQRTTLTVYATGKRFSVFAPDGSAVVDLFDNVAPAADSADAAGSLLAPMPGKVIAFFVGAGDRVVQGQPLAVLEAMKMEHAITAPRDGTIAELLYAVGDQVGEGGELLRMVPAA